jgi:hypothetical protein
MIFKLNKFTCIYDKIFFRGMSARRFKMRLGIESQHHRGITALPEKTVSGQC